jgi:pilus assembly protein Flp/PilA
VIYQPKEQGQGLVEYAFILMLIALVLIALVTIFGVQVRDLYSTIYSAWPF